MANNRLDASISYTWNQLKALWLHYYKESLPTDIGIIALGEQLQDKLGVAKLRDALALVNRDVNLGDRLSFEMTKKALETLDVFYAAPELFEEFSVQVYRSLNEDNPERLFQDGLKDFIWVDGKLYRYEVEDVSEFVLPTDQTLPNS